jgi:general secretion pathway protein E
LNNEERNILTVEDPIEYQLPGIGQMQVRPKIDLTFANCLRHILRQDPDIIMIGEIRDRETAEIAIQASLTGHLVLSTLHTNDAASAITRLVDMGIEPYLISATVVGVMAQRLLRVICPQCKQPYEPKDGSTLQNELRPLANGRPQLYRGRGCDECLRTGYHGRTGIFELLLIDHDMKEVIIEQRGPYLMKQVAVQKGMTTLREDGLRKALAGVTTLAEVYRVTQDSARLQEEVRPHAHV